MRTALGKTLVLYGALIVSGFAAAVRPDPTAALRQELEASFRKETGIGFASFGCDVPPPTSPVREFGCHAVDDDGDRFLYRVDASADGGPRVRMLQPFAQIKSAGGAALDRACRRLFEALVDTDFEAAHAALGAEMQAKVGVAELRQAMAGPIKRLGPVSGIEAAFYTAPRPGLHVGEYLLSTEPGTGLGLCQVMFDDSGAARIVGFLISSQPGSALAQRMLEPQARLSVEELLGRPIRPVDADFSQFSVVGDAVEADAIGVDGSRTRMLIEVVGTMTDFDPIDFSYQVLDPAFLMQELLIENGEAVASVDCPAAVISDGASVICTVEFTDGRSEALRLERRGYEFGVSSIEAEG